jgi:stearoyl-CoA desaturase (delta-9 desaturase)
LQQQATFCVNSLCHFAGTRQYYKGTAGDIWWMALFLLGENWHNFHHAFPSDYRNGAKYYHFDVHKWIIYTMSKVGLAWDLDRTPEVRVLAKMKEVKTHVIEVRKQQLGLMELKINQLLEHLYEKLALLDDSSTALKAQFKKSVSSFQLSLSTLAGQLSLLSSQLATEKFSEKLLKITRYKITRIEMVISRFYNQLDHHI